MTAGRLLLRLPHVGQDIAETEIAETVHVHPTLGEAAHVALLSAINQLRMGAGA